MSWLGEGSVANLTGQVPVSHLTSRFLLPETVLVLDAQPKGGAGTYINADGNPRTWAALGAPILDSVLMQVTGYFR